MARHFVIMSSSYSEGRRIAIDYSKEKELKTDFLENQIKKIKEECDETVPISTHFVQTETEEWESLVKADSFFKDVKVVDIEEFIRLIKIDRELKGIDVAKYILSTVKCTHLKLEKLVYLAYAEYLTKTDGKLFDDKIYAFKYGPVVDTVYNRYKQYGNNEVEDLDLIVDEILEMPARSRILFAKDGRKKLECIDDIIQKYGEYKASELVDLTHKEKTPWSQTFDNEKFKEISDETIKKYHLFEK